jgi:nitrite reductase/ring-hydroxylating ferredoxin subunit
MARPWTLREYGLNAATAEAVITEAGRAVCPHKKVDLTGQPCEPDGIVVCPLHRLRVRVPENAMRDGRVCPIAFE